MSLVRFVLKTVAVAAWSLGFGALIIWLARACGPRSAGFAFLLVWLNMCWVTLVLWAFPVRDAQGLAKLDAAMRNAETNHVIMFLTVVLVIVHAIVRGCWDAAAWTLLFNILINLYPVMLQRYNRGRLRTPPPPFVL